VALKARMPWLDINQERHHPYAGYEGMVELVQEIDRAIFNPVWQQVRIPAPWGDDGETLGIPATTPVHSCLAGVAAKAMGLEPEEVPV
jgi:nitrogenase molybdenum-cofactor synthesis protein NifE